MKSCYKEKTISSEIRYRGKVINVRYDDILSMKGNEHFREVVEHSGGVVVVPITDDNNVIFVKQCRYPIKDELIELPAGKLEEGEDTLFAAQRELQEETGFIAKSWEYLGFVYSTPGFCDEKLHLYKATGLIMSDMQPDEDEIIENITVSIDEALNMAKTGKIVDAKTIVGLSLVKF